MVVGSDIANHLHILHITDIEVLQHSIGDLCPLCGMGLHDLKLVSIKFSRLEQNTVGNGDLSDIVQGGEKKHILNKLLVETEYRSKITGDKTGVTGHSLKVEARLGVSVFRHHCRCFQGTT